MAGREGRPQLQTEDLMLFRYWIFAGLAIAAPAQTFTTLVSFNGNNGSEPLASLGQGVDGNLYGTTYAGADGHGAVLKVTPGGALTTPCAAF
jgi:uncharacterized repeat protein (TIGR03803 family)